MSNRLTPYVNDQTTGGMLEGSMLSFTTDGQFSVFGTPGGDVGIVLDIHELDAEIEQQQEHEAAIARVVEFGGVVKFLEEYNASIAREWSGLADIERVIERDVELIERVGPAPDVFEFGAPIELLAEFTSSINMVEEAEAPITSYVENEAAVSRVVEIAVSIEYKITREVEA